MISFIRVKTTALMLLCAVVGGIGCSSEQTPERTLRRYLEALAEGKAPQVWELSDGAAKKAMMPPALAWWMKKNPRLVVAAYDRVLQVLGPSANRAEEITETSATFSSGDVRLILLKENGSWRVSQGGLLLPRLDTPEMALKTYFFAATGHLGLFRRALPHATQEMYKSDYLLGTFLYAHRDQIFAARDSIGPIYEGQAAIDGDRAIFAYKDDKECVLVREDGQWRVLSID